ncbi:pro-thyrotropin-releasing hormone isoform X1 [Solea solea]|uniref:pro-thyrotropin-releasing hormone isoform X1 n=1 Tax=Solea solea TaxID=90069 RepID=UPI00272ACE98|nr:pro-thyrotropin-releasing hormone isoform X1 [Solea solea]
MQSCQLIPSDSAFTGHQQLRGAERECDDHQWTNEHSLDTSDDSITTMKSICLLILASLVLCNLALCGGQGLPADDDTDRRTIDDILLQRAESVLLRSILRKMQDEDDRDEGFSSQPEWVTKRQHPGKRYSDSLEKRQHPGRRELDLEDEDEQYLDVQRRQHPGKREDEMHSFTEIQKRQHPGKRSMAARVSGEPLIVVSELSKRQHPGKRFLVLQTKRQHPGKRQSSEDEDAEDGDWDAGADGDEDLVELEKRQHPGKRLWDNSSPDLGTNSPCDVLDPTSCSKASLLLDFLDNINKSHAEEKRQHPGKRFAPEENLVKDGE